jgi:hypothetical protein
MQISGRYVGAECFPEQGPQFLSEARVAYVIL